MVFAGIPALLASRPIVSAWAIACLPVPSGALTIDLPVTGRSRAFRGTLDKMGELDDRLRLRLRHRSDEQPRRALAAGTLEAEARRTRVCASSRRFSSWVSG